MGLCLLACTCVAVRGLDGRGPVLGSAGSTGPRCMSLRGGGPSPEHPVRLEGAAMQTNRARARFASACLCVGLDGNGVAQALCPRGWRSSFTLSSVRSVDTPRAIEGPFLLEYLICMRATDVNSVLRASRDRDEECPHCLRLRLSFLQLFINISRQTSDCLASAAQVRLGTGT